MTSKRERPEDLLRAMRAPVVPVESPEAARALRERTVAHLRGLQARVAVRREMHGAWRKRALIAAAILLPSGALAMSQVPWERAVVALRPLAFDASESVATRATRLGLRKHAHVDPPAAAAAGDPQPSPGAATSVEPERQADMPTTAPLGPTPARPPHASGEAERSTLSEENRLMQAALAAARAGDDPRAIALLTELSTRYPASPLAQNAQVERFRALSRSGAAAPAAAEARRYLNEHPNGMASDEARALASPSLGTEPGHASFR